MHALKWTINSARIVLQSRPATGPQLQGGEPAPNYARGRFGRTVWDAPAADETTQGQQQEQLVSGSAADSLGFGQGWYGLPPQAESSIGGNDDFRVTLVKSRRPLSAKPSEMKLRESQLVTADQQLRERAAFRELNKNRHGGEGLW